MLRADGPCTLDLSKNLETFLSGKKLTTSRHSHRSQLHSENLLGQSGWLQVSLMTLASADPSVGNRERRQRLISGSIGKRARKISTGPFCG
jgi:hypothetical protein